MVRNFLVFISVASIACFGHVIIPAVYVMTGSRVLMAVMFFFHSADLSGLAFLHGFHLLAGLEAFVFVLDICYVDFW